MKKEYIEKERLTKWLECNYQSIEETIDKYKDKMQKIGTIADGGQIGMKMAYQGVLSYINCTDLFKSHTIIVDDENEEQDRVDFANQFKYFIQENYEDFHDYMIVEKYINKWLENAYK